MIKFKAYLKRLLYAFVALFLVFFLIVLIVTSDFFLQNYVQDPKTLVGNFTGSGGVIVSRNNVPMRLIPSDRGEFVFNIPLASYSINLQKALIIAEDKNFYSHNGVDLMAVLRAIKQNVLNFKVVSGASTISQQLIRILYPRPRTFATKISEALIAMRLERTFSKKKILEMYMNFAPMFGNIRGMNLAARLLYGKSPDVLSIDEAAAIVSIPQSPFGLSPFKRKTNLRLMRRRNRILGELYKANQISKTEYNNAIKASIPTYPKKKPFRAPHFCDFVIKKLGKISGTYKSTIDLNLQELLYKSIRAHIDRLRRSGATQACGMIVSARNMQILGMVGSAEYGKKNDGFNNGCFAKRSGGSILKPFLYSLALERGYYPSFVIPDTMRSFKTPQGDYLPVNANRKSYGPVTIRTALGNSLNISAVKMLNLIGIKDFFDFLKDIRLLKNKKGASGYFGLGLAIGNPEIRMFDLVQAYGIIANNGNFMPLSYGLKDLKNIRNIISTGTAFIIKDIMADPSARLLTFGNPKYFKFNTPIALKTGTSTNYRDCWIVGVSANYIVCIWVGNFNGSPTRGLSGSSACAPILKDIFSKLENKSAFSAFKKPDGVVLKEVCGISGQLPTKFCPTIGRDYFSSYSRLPPKCQFHTSNSYHHILPAQYAKWLKNRERKIDSDPFSLPDNIGKMAPYSIQGVDENRAIEAKSTKLIILGKDSGENSEGGKVKIVSPHDGDRFVMSSTHENYIRLRAIPEGNVKEVRWLIDGEEYIETIAPYEAYWPMTPGIHKITALSDSNFAKEISILVER